MSKKSKQELPQNPSGIEFITASEFARRSGYRLQRIREYKSEGKFTPAVIEGARYLWPRCKDELELLEQQRKPFTAMMGTTEREMSAAESRAIDVANLDAVDRVIHMLEERITGADGVAYQWARALNEVTKAKKSLLDLLEIQSMTLPRVEVESTMALISRQNRDMWLNFPMYIGQEMAEELKVDSKKVHDILLKHVRKYLERAATLPTGYNQHSDEGLSEGPDAPSTLNS